MSDSSIDNECIFCFEELDKYDVAILNCNHKFHLYCIKQWINKSKKFNHVCPLCNIEGEIINIEKRDYSRPSTPLIYLDDNTLNDNTLNANTLNENTINNNNNNTVTTYYYLEEPLEPELEIYNSTNNNSQNSGIVNDNENNIYYQPNLNNENENRNEIYLNNRRERQNRYRQNRRRERERQRQYSEEIIFCCNIL